MASRLIRRPPSRRLADLLAYLWIRGKRLFRRLAQQKATPHQVALGGALGVLIAFTPTFGVQMVLAIALAPLFRCSRLSALVMCYVTNPFTLVPLYTFTYRVGAWLTGQAPLRGHMRLLKEAVQSGSWDTAVGKVLEDGWRLMGLLWVGGIAVGLVGAAITYPVLVRFVVGHRQVREERKDKRELRRLERMTMAAGLATTGDAVPRDVKMPEPPSDEVGKVANQEDRVVEVHAKEEE